MSKDDPILCWTPKKQKRSEIIKLLDSHKSDELSRFIKARFEERYIRPLEGINDDEKHGFCIMAISCLMIEALQSFRRGWKKTSASGLSELAFCSFFQDNDYLKEFSNHGSAFYKHVRCGILHQAETTGGWTIQRKGVLFDAPSKKINATQFHRRLQKYLDHYCIELRQAKWTSPLWRKCERKLRAICANCDP